MRRGTHWSTTRPGPRHGASATWRPRPWLAVAIRLATVSGPVAVSVAVVYAAARALPVPQENHRALVWWAALSLVATAALVIAARFTRRLLPLAALLRLSLVFPDGAPSRFRVALRTGTVGTLEQRLAAARDGAAGRTPVEEAQLLLELVAHLDEHDPLTRGHSERVRAYAQSIGHELGLGRRELDLLNWAALLHDIGKLDVPHEILAKTGRPTPEEWELLRGHPAAGAKLAEPLRAWLGEWSAAIVEHHERWDGQGYPRGLAGDEISLAGRIVAVADVFDVITSTRSYKPSSSVAEARQELARCAGTQFDPEVVRALLSISVRQGRLAAPLAWAAHAAALVRLPATQAANGLSAGAAAVAVGVGVGIGAAIPPQRPVAAPPISPALRPAAPQVAHPAIVSHRPAKPGARPRLVRITPAAHVRRPVVATRRVAPVDPVENAAPAAQPFPSPPAQRPEPPAAAPEHAPAPRTARPPAAPAAVPVPKPASAREPVAPAPVSAVPAAAVPPPAETAAPLTGKVSEVTGDVASLTDDVASVADPSTPLDDDVSSVLDDVGSLTGHVTSLLLPPPPAASPSPPQAPSPSPDAPAPAQQGSGSVVDQAVSLLGGLGK